MRKIIFFMSVLLISSSVSFSQSLSTVNIPSIGYNIPTVGSNFNVPVNVASFPTGLRYIEVYFLYDPAVLTWVGTTNHQNSLTVSTSGSVPGMLKLNYNNGITSFNVTDGKLFDIQFKYLAGNSNLNFDITTLNYRCKYRIGSTTYNILTATNGVLTGGYANNVINGGNWGTDANWSLGIVPNSWQNVTVGSTSEVTIGSNAFANNLNLSSTGKLTLNSGTTLTVNGTFTIESDANNTGSFINNGTSTVTATVQRFITAWTIPTDGWRLVSSPVNNASIGLFAPGGLDDFYGYDEATNFWTNYKVTPFGFDNGKGYLCAYEVTSNKTFTGILNNTDITFTNLSKSAGDGWHLLGNPFTSSLIWNDDANWSLSNVIPTAKLLNNGGGYTDINSNGIIPAMQGFLVQVTNASNSITIPTLVRTHSNINLLNKSTVAEKLMLTVSSLGNNTYVESVVRTNDNASNAYDIDFDANFLAGMSGVPQLFSVVDSKYLSTNTLPTIGNNVVTVPMGFVAGTANNYQLKAEGINTFNCSDITLEDTKTNTYQNLMSNPVYNFTATASDNVNRFVLHFNSTLGVGEVIQTTSNIYSYGNDIYVNSTETVKQISIYNSIGQLIYTANNPQGLFKYSLNDKSTGYYIVKVITDKNVNSEKVFVK